MRRAVWRWGSLILILLVLFGGVRLKATENPFLETVPEGTRFMIHLRPKQNQWEFLLSHSGNEPLTSSGLTLNELAPFIHGSFALFIKEDGRVTLGVEGQLPDSLQRAFLEHGISVHAINSHRFLLSEDVAEPTESISERVGVLDRLLPGFSGSIIDLKQGAPHTVIRIDQSGLFLSLPSTQVTLQEPFFLKQAIFAGTFNSETAFAFPSLVETVFTEMSGGASLKDLFLTQTSSGSFSLFEDHSFFVDLHANITIPSLQKFLVLQYQLSNPTQITKPLNDGSSVQELRVGKDVPTPEITEDPAWTILRLDTETGSFFAGKSKINDTAFFTNSAEALIKKTSFREQKDELNLACGTSKNLFINTPEFLSYLVGNKSHFSTPIPLSNSNFVHVGIDKNLFGTKIRFCVDKLSAKVE